MLQRPGLLRRGQPPFVQQAAVDARYHGHVFRPLQPSLQLQAGHAHRRHIPQIGGQVGVLQAQGIRAPAGAVHAVGQTAGLGAGAPVAAALSQHGAHLALAGVAHTQRPVAEHLDLRAAAGADLPYLVPVQLPGQHHALHAQRRGRIGTAQREQAHLRAGVKRQVRHDLLCQGQQAPVLHQHRVHAHGAGLSQRCGRPGQLPVGQQGVQGQKDPHAPQMAIPHRRREFLVGKVFRAPPRVERTEAHIHRVRAVLHRGGQCLISPRGGQKLHHHRRLFWFWAFCSFRRSSAASFLARLASSR